MHLMPGHMLQGLISSLVIKNKEIKIQLLQIWSCLTEESIDEHELQDHAAQPMIRGHKVLLHLFGQLI